MNGNTQRRMQRGWGAALAVLGCAALAAGQGLGAGAASGGLGAGAVAPGNEPNILSNYNVNNLVTPVPPDYHLASGDVVNILVRNMPDLSRTALMVGSDGTLHLGYIDAPVAAAGKTTEDVAKVLAADLQKQEILVDPQVEVQVALVGSAPVVVSGAVRTPLVMQATRQISLVEALMRAGGPNDSAGSFVDVTHTTSQPGEPAAERLPLSQVMLAGDPRYNIELRGGDVVNVEPGGHVYVDGDVNAPGEYPITQGGVMTVSKAMAIAKGWTPQASPERALIVRRVEDGAPTVIKVNLRKVLKLQAPDLPLEADDVLIVPNNGWRTAGVMSGNIVVSGFGSALGYALADKVF